MQLPPHLQIAWRTVNNPKQLTQIEFLVKSQFYFATLNFTRQLLLTAKGRRESLWMSFFDKEKALKQENIKR